MTNLTNLQKEVMEYDRRYGWDNDRESHIVIHMSEELGEISRRILRLEGYKTEEFSREELAWELVDLLYLTLKLANKFNLDMEKEWYNAFDRYEKKGSRR
jgi:NTP pyrophosphatase (non-canonical NTP hydrolase)